MKKIAIQGHLTRSEDVIKILESLGGINFHAFIGNDPNMYYYIDNKNHINCNALLFLDKMYKTFILEEYKQKYINMENKRNIQIDLTTAKEWYKQGGDLRKIALQAFTEAELQSLPSSWEEYCKINPYLTKDKEFFLAPDGTVTNVPQNCYRRVDFTLSMSSKKRAEQFVVLSKLLQIRDYYNQGWEPDWDNEIENKFVIMGERGKLVLYVFSFTMCLFAFKTKELRDEFFENFKSDLEFIKEFL